ncbi:hypothetical protein CHLRE_11g467775v5 [Chlamydomonas reinhardtii]|uniref:BTB domain-containing protein n=1 Tax=Chlamydomonas reinhardtii TaxID=3055 RepID=A0A2K3D7Z9_CHLRE|nr:uncharacterized protein CHLRE_11g467775v5 [Chlamydomonas reinhardtii]PNW76655.1 hypothetical protein CHLRE_11g467775v5 [Chlamydomonas reinhardtii]
MGGGTGGRAAPGAGVRGQQPPPAAAGTAVPVAPAPAPHYRRTAAPRPPVGCSSNASQQASGASSQPPERLQQQQAQQQQQTAAGSSSSARVATGSGLVELRFVSSSPATAESEASSAQPQTGGKALFADRVLLWHASPSFARCIDEAMVKGSGGASKQIVIPMPASEEAAVWEPVLRLLRQEDLLPVTWANLPDLLRVAHAYDMAAVRSACVVFISLHVSQVSLRDAPLESAQNVLHLASLANRYLHMEIVLPTSGSGGGGGTGVSSSSKGGASAAFRASSTASAAAGTHCVGLEPQLLPLVACIPAAMQTALAPLQITSYYSSSPNHWLPVVDRLAEISRHREYNAIVTESVRAALLAALLAGVKGETPFIINR